MTVVSPSSISLCDDDVRSSFVNIALLCAEVTRHMPSYAWPRSIKVPCRALTLIRISISSLHRAVRARRVRGRGVW
jgi:hypothetical protein